MDLARCMLTISAALQLAFAQAEPAITGVWRGKSPCAHKESACREETVVYRFSPLQYKPRSFSVSADKIVDGKTVNMGMLEFRYVEGQQALICNYAQGVWRLMLDGNKMVGTLTRPDGSLFRRVLLHKKE
jgi:hypothetical protein